MIGLSFQDFSRLYSLRFGSYPASIEIVMESRVYSSLISLRHNRQGYYKEKFKTEYLLPAVEEIGPESHFGLGGCLLFNGDSRRVEDEGMVILKIPLLSECLGSKTLNTIADLFTVLSIVDDSLPTSLNETKQLLHISALGVDRSSPRDGAGIVVDISPYLCSLLREMSSTKIRSDLLSALTQVYGRLENKILNPYDLSDFRVDCDNLPLISLVVPGDACTLDPNCGGAGLIQGGYTLSPHNPDNTSQQFAFLAAMVRLDEIAMSHERYNSRD